MPVEVPTTAGTDPEKLASKIGAFVKEYELDGVDVDYEDFGAMLTGTAVPWLISE